ncbi:MAG: response regulator [Dehalococcoidia bacterium]|nr:response regulator [Dehalococcoidia bacterium]
MRGNGRRDNDGIEALERVKELRPDVVTLDIEMPRLDGLATIERIMQECPTRVVMVSTLTRQGADATLRALDLGAIDFVEKPTGAGTIAALDIAAEVAEKFVPPPPHASASAPFPGAWARWSPILVAGAGAAGWWSSVHRQAARRRCAR